MPDDSRPDSPGFALVFDADGLTLYVERERGEGSPGIVEDAIAGVLSLGEVEPLLRLLESWWRRGFDWEPGSVRERPADVWLRLRDTGTPGIGLALPDPADTPWPPLPQAFAATLEVAWRQIEGELQLDRFALDAEDRARLGVGALVLLPGSFGGSWHGMLRCAEFGTLPLRFDAGEILREVPGLSPIDDVRECRVVLPVEIPVERLTASLSGASLGALPREGTRVQLLDDTVSGAGGRGPSAGLLASGTLLRLGQGLAIRLDAVSAPAVPRSLPAPDGAR